MNKPAENQRQQEAFDYLVELRDSGITNMWGAAPYLYDHMQEYYGEYTLKDAGNDLVAWIESFKEA